MPAADSAGLTSTIDNMLLFRCVQIVRKLAKQDRRIGIFCNLSARSLSDETFFPQFLLGYLGMPRRYHFYPEEFQVLNVMSSAGASILGLGYVIPLIYLIWSLRYSPQAGPNPWRATGLEWQTPSPPPTDNFDAQPVVTEEAYAYGPKEKEVVVG